MPFVLPIDRKSTNSVRNQMNAAEKYFKMYFQMHKCAFTTAKIYSELHILCRTARSKKPCTALSLNPIRPTPTPTRTLGMRLSCNFVNVCARRTSRLPREDSRAEVGEEVRVGVRVGPVEFKLYATFVRSVFSRRVSESACQKFRNLTTDEYIRMWSLNVGRLNRASRKSTTMHSSSLPKVRSEH